ncbi:Uncharacterised protein [Mycolicibacterium vanbaalenii]|uniref:Uncharacterized protein n=1 Tax=Mycolicibacterium vanbaalenii TaxID=110539 RepID=A0A5S9PV71_MYCVN|nr:hypothetical protein [Mycolicibacterium vanbaalenii]CAA0108781.1 Uncharacterised protein [Mycolicibacterium vanbaalenii]
MGVSGLEPGYLAEWYRGDLTDEAVAAMVAALRSATGGTPGADATVRLVVVLAVPSDEVVYGLFTAASALAISDVCGRASLPPDRLTSDIGAWVARVGP